MKPTIPQSLKDQLPIDPIQDFNFSDDKKDNTGIFYTCYSMKDNTRECAGLYELETKLFKYTLN